MTTHRSGGKITGLLALTVDSTVALQVGDPVHIVGDYQVALADGTKRTLGTVGVRNVKRVGRDYPVADTGPGELTVEAHGLYVRTVTSAGAIAAGAPVGLNGSGGYVAVAAGHISECGIALQPAAGAAVKIDVLFR